MDNAANAPHGAKEAVRRRGPGLWLRIKARLRIMRLAMRAEEVVEEFEAPPGRLGWDAVAGYLGEDLEGYSTRRLSVGPGAPIGREQLAAALEAMGYPLTGRRVALTVVHGYGAAPRGAIHEEPLGSVKTETKYPRANSKKIEEAET